MGKLFLFSFLWWLTGNPLVAMLLILLVLYVLDRRFVRLLPDITKPYRRWRRLAALRTQLRLNPHDTPAKLEAARLHMEKRQYPEALSYLEGIASAMQDSPEYLCDKGICLLKTGRMEEGLELIAQALKLNPRVRYGEPYLIVGEEYAKRQQREKALEYLEALAQINMSSCEAYFKLGVVYDELQQKEKAKASFLEATEVYRGLPAYKRRTERRWALLAWLRKTF
ncbi:tetratricopeptide repeat protein [Brevibacillus sp. SAFN-007a]|uniref:tetratricopeptide repeat protein n=1 Tax=Brevibacillus sp. SAFN-007a TaxID=3436862 RepID=UPI003F7DEC52